ncbi:MAG: T9SS type A sorting domain-containing protein, partial [Saprospiraceae bacterium]
KVNLKNADNKDWEDLVGNGAYLYLGDFGNNYNDRQNLGLYRLPFSAIGSDNTETVDDDEWTFLPFNYTDQTDFSTQPEDSTEYDCEAMIFLNGAPQLFTKNRKHLTTTHYVVNTLTGQAVPLEAFDTQGLITGASLSPDGKLVILLGYELAGIPKIFCWLLWDWHDGLLFNGNKRRLELGNVFTMGQAEAIGFGGNRSGYLANERVVINGFTITPERTYAFDVSPWVPESVNTREPELVNGQLSPNPFSQTVQLSLGQAAPPEFLRVFNAWGQLVLETSTSSGTLDTSNWPPGGYVFECCWPSRTLVLQGVKQ